MLFYELKINYQRQTGEDNPGNVKETYLIEGLNCTDVEGRLMTYLKPYIFGDSEVQHCKKVQFFDLITGSGDKWYKGRVEMITVEDNGKETRKAVSILVQAESALDALNKLQAALSNYDCEVISVAKTAIMDVLRAGN